MPWLLALLGLGGLAALASGGGPKTGEMRRDPNPHTDETGRTFYNIERWNGTAWEPYGIQYLGGQ